MTQLTKQYRKILKKYTNSDTKNTFKKINKQKELKNELTAFNLTTLTQCFSMTEKGEELWLMLIIHIISKRSDSEILSYYVPYMIE